MKTAALHPVTVAALAVLAYSAANVVHEFLGHGGACLLVGDTPRYLNAIFLKCDDRPDAPAWTWRCVALGGVVANLVFAAAGSAVLRGWRSPPTPGRYLLWLFTTLNVMMPFGYLLFSGLLGFGDGAVATEGLAPAWSYRAGMALAGAVLYFVVAPRCVLPEFRRFLGVGAAEHQARSRRLSLLPYLVGGGTFLGAGLLNPEGWKLLVLSAAAASLGGTSLLVMFPHLVERMPADSGEPARAFPPHRGWWAAGATALVVFVGVLGPGVRLSPATTPSSSSGR